LKDLKSSTLYYITCAYADENAPDFNAVEAVVDVTHRYPEIFYPKEQ
jgi:hypothetical protein